MNRPFGRFLKFLQVIACLCASLTAQDEKSTTPANTNVTPQDLLTQPVGADWTSYNGDYSGRRFSSLRQINAENVAQLRDAWVFHPGNTYVKRANDVIALDARTGRTVWRHQRALSSGLLDDAAAHKSRGVAVW